MSIARTVRALVTAVVVALIVTAGAVPAQADYRIDCNPAGDSRQPIILVHGFSSSPGAWDVGAEQLSDGERSCVVRFGYAEHATDWVTSPAIGPALADQIARSADSSRAHGGSGRVVLVGHSMGGLAIRCAVDPVCGGRADTADALAGVITVGTPNLGSFLRSSGVVRVNLTLVAQMVSASCHIRTSGPAHAAACQAVRAFFTSDATKAFTPGSRELKALPGVPEQVPVYAVAGDITVGTSFFGYNVSRIGSGGDMVVGTDSATAAARQVDGLGGSGVVDCGFLDVTFSSGRFPDCTHVDETSNDRILTPARAQIDAILDSLDHRSRPPAPNSGQTDAEAKAWETADGNVACLSDAPELVCVIREYDYVPPPEARRFDELECGNGAEFAPGAARAEWACIGDTLVEPGAVPVFGPGTRVRTGPGTCTVQDDGITCVGDAGATFTLSRSSASVGP